MPKNSKKSPKRNTMKKEAVKKTEPKKTAKQRKTFKEAFNESRDKVWAKKNARLKLHHSFRRSYREDYIRPLDVPGMVSHAMSTLKIIFRNWKLFFGLLVIIVVSNIIFVGLMNQATYESAQESLEVSNEALGHGELGRMAEAAMMVVTTVTTGGLSNNMTEVQQAFAIFLFDNCIFRRNNMYFIILFSICVSYQIIISFNSKHTSHNICFRIEFFKSWI